MRLLILFLPIWALCAQGCQWLGRMDQARSVETAEIEHDACVARDHAWPDNGYTECRRDLANARQQRQWSELQMSRQQGQPEIGITTGSPIEPYRPIREENFRCREAVTADGKSYIACAEQASAFEQ